MFRNINYTIGEQIKFQLGGDEHVVNIGELVNPPHAAQIGCIQFARAPDPYYLSVVLKVIKEHPAILLRFYGDYPEEAIDWDLLHDVRNLVVDLWHTKSLAGVSKLTNLKSLGVHKNVKSTVSLSILKPLTRLVALNTSISRDVEVISSLPNLGFLYLNRIKNNDLDFLKPLHRLQELWISLGSYENYEGINALDNLRRLWLHRIKGFDNETANAVLSKCNAVTALELIDLKHITSLNFLTGLQRLSFLRLEGICNAASYQPVIYARSLRRISSTNSRPLDKDLLPLVNLDNIALGETYPKKEIDKFMNEYKGRYLWIHGKQLKGASNYYLSPFDRIWYEEDEMYK